ncbi:hypothetical protein KP509_38G023600 [Ceratopteris richardii]|nr:hypothetical protein KP509_38G023600 [Ceratopteris richardii]
MSEVAEKHVTQTSSRSPPVCAEGTPDTWKGRSNPLKQEREAIFFFSLFLCGWQRRFRDDNDVENKAPLFIRIVSRRRGKERSMVSSGGKEDLPWKQQKAENRRKIGSEGCNVTARLKRFMRKVRKNFEKMIQVRKVGSFRYDPLSYAMNFDEGCWLDSPSHPRLSCTTLTKDFQ